MFFERENVTFVQKWIFVVILGLLLSNVHFLLVDKSSYFTLVLCSWDESHAWCASRQPESDLSPEQNCDKNMRRAY